MCLFWPHKVFPNDCFTMSECHYFLECIGQWNATGKVLAVRNLTTPPWTTGVLVRRLTLLHGWNPLLLTRSPSRPLAALHICGVHTQTHTWRQSPCLDSRERSALRCDAEQWGPPAPPPPPSLCTSDQKINRHKTGAFAQTLR